MSVSKRLAGKTVLITGASSGIGRSTALEFASTAKTLKLILTARRIDRLQQLAGDISSEFPNVTVHPVQLDISNADEVRGFVDNLPAEFRDVDVLLNNTGLVKGIAQAPSILEEDITTMLSTNVTSLINMTQASGDIINIGSIAGRKPYVGGSIYCTSKAAVRSFTEALRKELISKRVRAITIDPGQVETEFSGVRFYGDRGGRTRFISEGCEPLTPEDIAEVIVFAAGRRENVVVADTLLFPNHQASATIMHRRA